MGCNNGLRQFLLLHYPFHQKLRSLRCGSDNALSPNKNFSNNAAFILAVNPNKDGKKGKIYFFSYDVYAAEASLQN